MKLCIEIRCRDCERVISACRCPGEKPIVYHQCRDCYDAEQRELALAHPPARPAGGRA